MAQAHTVATNQHDPYYVPHSSKLAIYGSLTLFVLMAGAVATLNAWLPIYSLVPGFIMLASLFVSWFYVVIGENQHGMYNLAVDRSFRLGMMWFIFSEVMFFAAFFGALFYVRQLSVPWLSGDGTKIFTNLLLWKGYSGQWPRRTRSACRRQLRDRAGTRTARDQYGHPADEQRHGDDRTPRIDRGASRPPQGIPGTDILAGFHLRLPPGRRIS